jgi:hypothetical protein
VDNFTGYKHSDRLRVVYTDRSMMMDKGLLSKENPADVSEQLRAAVQGEEVIRTNSGKVSGVKKPQHSGLTARQQAFVLAVSKGLTYSDAYRQAYSCDKSTPQTVSTEANKLLNNPKVAMLLEQRINRQENVILANKANTQAHIKAQLLEHAHNFKTESGKLKALELLGKSVGMFTDRVESTVIKQTPEDLKKQLSQHLALLDTESFKH